jgi:hypothetical protein
VFYRFFVSSRTLLSAFFSKLFLPLLIFLAPLLSANFAYGFDRTFAWNKNTESDIAGYYIYYKNGSSGPPYNGTGAIEGNSPVKIPFASLNDPENPTFTIHGLSATGTFYFVATAYDNDGNESGYSTELSYTVTSEPPAITLSSLSIDGGNSITESSNADYTATAFFSNGSTQNVTSSTAWNENSAYAGINSSGVLTTSAVPSNQAVTVQAAYTYNGTTKTATKVVTIIDVPPSNLPPNVPVIISPVNGQTQVDMPLDIIADTFSDPNNDAHSQSQWQISEQSDFATLVVDSVSSTYLTSLPVPQMVLIPNQTYYVRVRFYDTYLAASDWSETIAFTTSISSEDLNSNGIPDANEVSDTDDFNLDGIPDNTQPDIIKSIRSADGSTYFGVEKFSSSISEIESLELVDPNSIADNANRPNDLIFGLVSFRLRVDQPGATVFIRIYFSGEIFENDVYYKYDRINGWYDYSDHTTHADDGQSVVLELKDGGFGDSDGTANGIIVDPGGITTMTDDGIIPSESGGSSGCFIATAAFGSKFEKQVQLLRRFRDFYLLSNSIGRAFVRAYYRYSPPMADFIARHDTLRMMVRWSLVPFIGMSWMLLHLGLFPTLLLITLISSGILVFVRRFRF